MGISPRRFCGWEPVTITEILSDGRQVSTRAPEWDAIDRHIMREWKRLLRHLCPKCDRPLLVHESDSEMDYGAGYFTCTSTLVLDKAQADAAKKDKRRIKDGENPERSRLWTVYEAEDGPPVLV